MQGVAVNMRKLIGSILLATILFGTCVFFACALTSITDKEIVSTYVAPVEELPDIIDRVMPSVVHIYHEDGRWQGSGVAITSDIIVTARHVVEGGNNFTITLYDGTEIEATKAISSVKYDIGFIKLDKPILYPARFGNITECRLGQDIFTIGSPYGKENFNRVTLGIVSGLNLNLGENYGWKVVFSTDASGHPGNSGCPVFTLDGVVRGILVAGRSSTLVYCVPVDVFATDGATIRMMFAQTEYYLEGEYTEDDYYRDLVQIIP